MADEKKEKPPLNNQRKITVEGLVKECRENVVLAVEEVKQMCFRQIDFLAKISIDQGKMIEMKEKRIKQLEEQLKDVKPETEKKETTQPAQN